MKGPKEAFCMIRSEPQYRREAFVRGLQNAGYQVREHFSQGAPNKVIVLWNRYGGNAEIADRFEKQGGTVVIAENGYMANDRFNRQRYAIALGAHNGQGVWWVDLNADRFSALGIEIQPWRTSGDYILVCPSRAFGRVGHIMPVNWTTLVVEQLRKYTKRPIKIRMHPGENKPGVALADDLKKAWALVTWYSSTGCDALIAGVPVFQCAPNWVGQSGSFKDLSQIENPPLETIDRQRTLNEVAWAQWHIEEIASGAPFQYLLNRAHS